ncbi:MAG: hypothetical protein AAFU78_13980 [Cyanobacteria bacterium J06633_2]
MNSNDIAQFVQKGFHITLGAASLVADSIQNPEKRDENMAKLNGDFNVLSEELAVEGAKKDQEARQLVETLVGQVGTAAQPSSTSGYAASSKSSTPAVPADIVQDLKTLTLQLSSIREDLEKERE